MFAFNQGYVMTRFSDPRDHLMVGAALGSLVLGILLIVLSSRSRRGQTVNATEEPVVHGRFGQGRGCVSAIPRQAA